MKKPTDKDILNVIAILQDIMEQKGWITAAETEEIQGTMETLRSLLHYVSQKG